MDGSGEQREEVGKDRGEKSGLTYTNPGVRARRKELVRKGRGGRTRKEGGTCKDSMTLPGIWAL